MIAIYMIVYQNLEKIYNSPGDVYINAGLWYNINSSNVRYLRDKERQQWDKRYQKERNDFLFLIRADISALEN